MFSLIAIDGYSLNAGLQKVAQNRKDADSNIRPRFRIDYARLAEFLTEDVAATKESSLNFYTDCQPVKNQDDPRLMGRVVKYFAAKGYGFIAATDGNSYFFHNSEISNKRALCDTKENRYPHPTSSEFANRVIKKIVTFVPVTVEGKSRAEDVKLEFNSDKIDEFYRLRKEPFLAMLEDEGYKLVRCRSTKAADKSKGIDCRIYLDTLSGRLMESEDSCLVLLTDDPIYIELLQELQEMDIRVTLVTFENSRSLELRNFATENDISTILLDDHLDDLELSYEDDFEDEEEASEEQEALALS